MFRSAPTSPSSEKNRHAQQRQSRHRESSASSARETGGRPMPKRESSVMLLSIHSCWWQLASQAARLKGIVARLCACALQRSVRPVGQMPPDP